LAVDPARPTLSRTAKGGEGVFIFILSGPRQSSPARCDRNAPVSSPLRGAFGTLSGVIRVLVAGAAGRMGQAVVAAVRGAGDMELVAQVDPAPGAGEGVVADLGAALPAARP